MDDFEKILQESKKNAEFAELWENSKIEYEVMKKIVAARTEKNITQQQQLAERTGLRQSNISRIENGAAVPNLKTLETIAKGLGKTLIIDFV